MLVQLRGHNYNHDHRQNYYNQSGCSPMCLKAFVCSNEIQKKKKQTNSIYLTDKLYL